MPRSTLFSLAGLIAANAEILEEFYLQLESRLPSEDGSYPDLPDNAPDDIVEAQQILLGASAQLSQLVEGPRSVIGNMHRQLQITNALRWLYHFKIHTHVPSSGEVSMAEVASLANVPLRQLQSHSRMAIAGVGYFSEPRPEHLAHSAASLLVSMDPDQDGYAWFSLEAIGPALNASVDATTQFGDTTAKNQTAYNAAFKTDQPMFDHLFADEDHSKGQKFAGFTKTMSKMGNRNPKYLVEGFNWENFATIVDVGGGRGYASVALLEAIPSIKSCIVQDLPGVISIAQTVVTNLPATVSSRLHLQAQDFFKAQPPGTADLPGPKVFLLRNVLHDWPDDEAIAIIIHLVSNLEPEDRIIVQEVVVPTGPSNGSLSLEDSCREFKKNMYAVGGDHMMMALLNAKERTMADWRTLMTRANENLVVKNHVSRVGSVWDVIEIGLK